MKVSARIVLAVAVATLCVVACSRGPRIIPRSKMEKIYTDLLMADQWLAVNSDNSVAVDTTLFYEAVFRRYGFTTEDFNASLEYYMRDPLKFSRMMKDVAVKLEYDADRLQTTYEEFEESEEE